MDHEAAKEQAHDWLLRGFLRDAIEGTGLFLDECLQVCGVMQFAAKGIVSGEQLHYLLNDLPRKNHRLHLPKKLEKLAKEFSIVTRFDPNVLSLNRARTCVVHRLGTVSALDLDETGTLTIIFQHAQFVSRGELSGNEVPIEEPGILMTEESMLELRFIEKKRSFQLGEQVCLEAGELYDTIVTLWRFGRAMAQAIEAYGKSLGLQFPAIPSEDT